MPPPLTWWASGKALEQLGWTNPKLVSREEGVKAAGKARKNFFINNEEYYDWLQECYREHDNFKKKRGEEGTDAHGLIEQAVKEAIRVNKGFLFESYENPVVERFATWGRGKKFLYSEVHVYSEFLWLGGIIDIVYEDGGVFIGDVKTSKNIYPNQFIQAGLYDLQQGENGFFTAGGFPMGSALPVDGYTVVNLPEAGGVNTKTYRDTKATKALGISLVEGYKSLQVLEAICK